MSFEIVDPVEFLDGEIFSERVFLQKADAVDWSIYNGKKVLVRGCGGVLMPPWVFMYLTGKLAPYARSIRYGNEHDNLVVFRIGKDENVPDKS